MSTQRPRQKPGSGCRSLTITDHPGRPLGFAQVVEQHEITIGVHALSKAAVGEGAQLPAAGQIRQNVMLE